MAAYIGIHIRRYYRSPQFWVALVFFLLLLTAFSGKPELSETEPMVTIGVVDRDDTALSRMLVSYFEENPSFSSFAGIITGEETEIQNQFESGEIYGYMVIPENFISDLTVLKNTPVTIHLSTENPTLTLLAENVLHGYEKYIQAVEQNAQAIYEKLRENGMSEKEAGSCNETATTKLLLTLIDRENIFEYESVSTIDFIPLVEYYGYALLAALIVFGALFLCQDMILEKETRIAERNEMCGFGSSAYLLSRYLVLLFKLLPFWAAFFFFAAGMEKRIALYRTAGRALFLFSGFYLSFELLTHLLLKKLSPKNVRKGYTAAFLILFFLAFTGGVIIPYMYLPQLCHSFAPTALFYRIMNFLTA